MAGVKRRTKYRKNVAQELEDFVELEEGDLVARVLGSRGGNLFDVESQDGVVALCRLPTRFRKMVWIKRGSFIVCVQAADDVEVVNGKGKAKVLFAATAILMDHQVKHLRQTNQWPERFMTEEEQSEAIATREEQQQSEDQKEEEVVAPRKGSAAGADSEKQSAPAPVTREVSESEQKARVLERYMYEESSEEDDDDLEEEESI